MKQQFPENVLVFASHASADIPPELQGALHPDFNERLQRNFSDWGTKELIADVPEHKKVLPTAGRIAGDPNRPPNHPDFLRRTDFNNNPIFKDGVEPSAAVHHIVQFNKKIEQLLSVPHGKQDQILWVFDVHDTGNRMLGRTLELDSIRPGWSMPSIVLSDADGRTADPAHTRMVQRLAMDIFDLPEEEVCINNPYKGGHVTQYWSTYTHPTNTQQRAHIQMEFNRRSYLHEETQEICPESMQDCRNKLMRLFCAIGRLNNSMGT